jgi:formylglycine-generating enzyme required for sulfatase activity
MTPPDKSFSPQDGAQEQHQNDDFPPSGEDSGGREGASFMTVLFRIFIIVVITCIVLGGTVGTLSWVLNRSGDPTNDEPSIGPDSVNPSDDPEASNSTDWPFDATEAQRRQEETASTLDVPVEYKNDIGMTFRIIPSGSFVMGADDDSVGTTSPNGPPHPAKIENPFYISCYETTQGNWHNVLNSLPEEFLEDRLYTVGVDNPIFEATWYDVVEFCNALSEMEGFDPYYLLTDVRKSPESRSIKQARVSLLGGTGYRLPRETEWEYACRAGTQGIRYGNLDEICWHRENSPGRTQPVGKKTPNAFLLYDMLGNMTEWCQDWLHEGYSEFSWKPLHTRCAIRGGSVASSTQFVHSASRHGLGLNAADITTGFRVARSILDEDGIEFNEAAPLFGAPILVPEILSNGKKLQVDNEPHIRSIEEAMDCQWGAAVKLLLPVECENKLGMKFRFIPPGEFLMGGPSSEEELAPTEQSAHTIAIPRPYYLGLYEVTQKEWATVVGNQYAQPEGESVGDDFPMHTISWYDAIVFCNALSRRDDIEPFYDITILQQRVGSVSIMNADITILGGPGYRLATEAEWEYACRGGILAIDLIDINEAAWHRENSEGSTCRPVGGKLENPFLLYDMLGNVSEWCQNGFEESGTYDSNQFAENDPVHMGLGDYHAVRGAHAMSPSSVCRPAMRGTDLVNLRRSGTGFRIAFTPPATQTTDTTEEATSEPEETMTTTDEPDPSETVTQPETLTAVEPSVPGSDRQQEEAQRYYVPVEIRNQIGIKFRLIPAGEFIMGREGRVGALPHLVHITKPFYMSDREISRRQWEEVTSVLQEELAPDTTPTREDDYPVVHVSWYDAISFCNMLSEQDGVGDYYRISNIKTLDLYKGIEEADVEILGGNGYRLPTEAEWEYASRAGDESDGVLLEKSRIRLPEFINPFGLRHLNVTVGEWCWDGYVHHYYKSSPIEDPQGSGTTRGRSKRMDFANNQRRYWDRSGSSPNARYDFFGLVVVRNFTNDDSDVLPTPPVHIPTTPPTSTGSEPDSLPTWPFDASEAQRRIDQTATQYNIPAQRKNDLGMTLQLIPPGEFLCGSPEDEPDRHYQDADLHRVVIEKPFYMSAYETTQIDMEGTLGSEYLIHPTSLTISRNPRYAVYGVMWCDAIAFCNALNEREGLEPCYEMTNIERFSDNQHIKNAEVRLLGGPGYRLPINDEWEYACRAGTNGPLYGPADEFGRPQPQPLIDGYSLGSLVGEKQPNAFHLYDMMGNVDEWCEDWPDDIQLDYQGSSSHLKFDIDDFCVSRGGSTYSIDQLFRVAYRRRRLVSLFPERTGFRVVYSPPGLEAIIEE